MSPRGDRPIPNSYWVAPGRFVAGEYPGAFSRREAEVKLDALLRAGINHFVDLTEAADGLRSYADTLKELAAPVGRSVSYERRAIRDASVPRTPGQMAATLDAIDAAIRDGKTVYVHCWGGVGRTGTVVGCWLVRHGHAGQAALLRIAKWWLDVEKNYRHPRSPETLEQEDYVRNWREPTGADRAE